MVPLILATRPSNLRISPRSGLGRVVGSGEEISSPRHLQPTRRSIYLASVPGMTFLTDPEDGEFDEEQFDPTSPELLDDLDDV